MNSGNNQASPEVKPEVKLLPQAIVELNAQQAHTFMVGQVTARYGKQPGFMPSSAESRATCSIPLETGVIEQLSRGAYRLVELPSISNPNLVTMSLRFPKAVICLISALAYHDITTQVPRNVSVAVPRDSRLPWLDYPPVLAHRVSEQAYQSGIEEHRIDGLPVKVYSPEKTLADCFKFPNKIGMDVVLEALKLYKAPNLPRQSGWPSSSVARRCPQKLRPSRIPSSMPSRLNGQRSGKVSNKITSPPNFGK